MPDPDALIQIPLGNGQEETQDRAFVPPSKLRYAQNCVSPDGNALVKRYGMTSRAGIPNLRRLASANGQVLGVDGVNAFSYSSTLGDVVGRGRVSMCMASTRLLGQSTNAGGSSTLDDAPVGCVAEASGYQVAIWCVGTAVLANVYDVAGGTYARPTEPLNASRGTVMDGSAQNKHPHLIAVSASTVLAIYRLGNGDIVFRSLDLTNVALGWSTEATLLSMGSPSGGWVYECSAITGTTNFALATAKQTGTTLTVDVYIFSGVGTQTNHVVAYSIPVAVTPTAIGVRAISGQALVVAWASNLLSSGTNYYSIDCNTWDPSTLAPILATFNIRNNDSTVAEGSPIRAIGIEATGVGSGTSAQFVLVYSNESYLNRATGHVLDQTIPYMGWATFAANASSLLSSVGPNQGLQMMSKPFGVTVNDTRHVFVYTMYADYSQTTQFLMDLSLAAGAPAYTAANPSATVAPAFSLATGSLSATDRQDFIRLQGHRTSDVSFAGDPTQTRYSAPSLVQQSALSTSIGVTTFDFASANLWQSVKLGPYSYLAGGVPQIFDGSYLTEVGFLHAPPPPAVGVSGSGPGNPTSVIVAVYSQADGLGNIHRSAPSAPVTVDMTSASTAEVRVMPYRYTYRQSTAYGSGVTSVNPVEIEIYQNSSSTQGTLQLVKKIQNDPTSTVPLVTGVTTAPPSTSPVLFTQGGFVTPRAPPSLGAMAVHADRVVGTSDDGHTQWFTTPLTDGEAPVFSNSFTTTWPEGPATAAWSLEGRLYVATTNKILFMTGNGPADNGAGSDFSTPQVWQSAIGVQDAHVVSIGEPGAFFYGPKGLYLVTRGQELVWVGEHMRTTLALYKATSIACLDTDRIVKIACGGGPFGTGVTIHFDHARGLWFTHVITANGSAFAPAASNCVANGTYYAAYSGALLAEDPTAYTDQGTWITMQMVTAWFKPADLQGWTRLQRMSVLGECMSPHGLRIECGTDYEYAYSGGTATWTASEIGSPTLEQLRFMPAIQKGEAYTFRITDLAPTSGDAGNGQGATLRGLLLKVRGKRGEYRNLSTAQNR